MRRWLILAGCLALIGVAMSAIGPIQAKSAQAQSSGTPTIVITAQGSGIATAQVGPLPPAPPIGVVPPAPPIYPNDAGHVLRLTPRDNGGVFNIPVGTLIDLYLPRMPRTRLDYNPAILQEISVRPLPMQSGGASPDLIVTPTDSTPEPNPSGPKTAPIGVPWRLIAIAPGTSPLSLQSVPCPPGQMCPMYAILAFRVTITVERSVYPNPTPVPPLPPYSNRNPDVYISTAYLDQTVVVQPGQVIALELPFLAADEPITLDFDSAILSPLPGQDLQHPQPGGWLFRMIAPGKTLITVQATRCLDGSGLCTPSLLFRVTVTSGTSG